VPFSPPLVQIAGRHAGGMSPPASAAPGQNESVILIMERGVFCISIDFELAWAFVDDPDLESQFIGQIQRMERPVVRGLLELFHKYEVSATWATVGSLLEVQPVIRGHSSGPVPLEVWYAPDLVDQIRAATPEQEIGSHSFAHLVYSRATRDQAAADLDAAARIHQAHGLDFVSFAFPKNAVNHLDLLAQRGIRVFRRGASTELLSGFGRLGRFVDKLLPIAPRTAQAGLHETGLIELPGCMPLMARNGVRRLVSPRVILCKARAALERAASQKSLFHFCFHPHNFYFHADVQFKLLEAILAAACELRRKGMLDLLPMKGFCGMRAK
jgi:hypothetical protein